MKSRYKHLETAHMSLSVPEDIKNSLEVIAAERDMSTSALCRELFRKEIEQHEICENSRPCNR